VDNYSRARLDQLKASEYLNLRGVVSQMYQYFESNPKGTFVLNFHVMQFRNIAVLLMFRAWLQRVLERNQNATLIGNYGENESWISLYRRFGFFKIAPPKKPITIGKKDNGIQVKFACETDLRNEVNPEPELAYEVCQFIGTAQNSDIARQNILGAAINEAIHNIKNWAYDEYHSVSGCRWWVAAVFNVNDRSLNVIVYDMGVGIPQRFKERRLDKLGLMSSVLELGVDSTENQILLAAMKLQAENARQLLPDGRCRGLQQMRTMTANFSPGSFNVYSGASQYHMLCLGGRIRRCSAIPPPSLSNEARYENFTINVPGTLVSWTLKV